MLLIGFCVGALTDWRLASRRDRLDAAAPIVALPAARGADPGRGLDDRPSSEAERNLASSGSAPGLPAIAEPAAVLDELRRKDLLVPVDGSDPSGWKGWFEERRPAGHQHEAVDILAPRGTPVRAVDDGVVARLLESRGGGISVYQYDPTRRYIYYYAHLEGYAGGIDEGDEVRRGQVVGYVGTTGNAPPDTPHLHFAIFQLLEGEDWWQGRAIDPYLAYGE